MSSGCGKREQKASILGRSDGDGDGGTGKYVEGHERRLGSCGKREQKANVPDVQMATAIRCLRKMKEM